MNQWRKDIAAWKVGETLYLSVPFTWLMGKAESIARGMEPYMLDHKQRGVYHKSGLVIVGGPGAELLPDGVNAWGRLQHHCPGFEPILFHNPLATFTTRGCVHRCPWCAVWRVEGEFREIPDFRPAPMVCDNNLLAASKKHFRRVIDALKDFAAVDFNQGLDARLLTPWHVDQIERLRNVKVRFAFDHAGMESHVADALALCRKKGLRDFGVYVLIGFQDTPETARYRLEKVRSWDVRPTAMRYQPLEEPWCLKKNSFLDPAWGETDEEMAKMQHYYNALRWTEGVPYEEFIWRERKPLPLFEGQA